MSVCVVADDSEDRTRIKRASGYEAVQSSHTSPSEASKLEHSPGMCTLLHCCIVDLVAWLLVLVYLTWLMLTNANEDDDEDSGDELQHASVESANTSDDWRLLVMDLDDALAKLDEIGRAHV